MSIFQRKHYTSEVTDFLNDLKKQHPSLDAEQVAGRALLWDKKIDRDAWEGYDAGEIKQKPYVYQTDNSGN
ncbi:DUF3460 family protein [Xylophilus rhododendri]|uniref:DUF3460 family protein n=1 Tax=Xylophilus rhododendri TaxID=2697032 RepID=A0A857J9I1_9BURK|nr:DUF3460 family protein [Xylophilus rhododendri]QHJ00655.1 DUF3460 family protein [Xylophilus rhododendri]